MSGEVYSTAEIEVWETYFERIDRTGAYHSPAYLSTLAGNFEPPEEAELFVFDPDDTEGFVYYPYLRRPLSSLAFTEDVDVDLTGYSDIVSSWYYGGPLLSDPDVEDGLAERFVECFGETCAERGVVAEFIRFDPTVENHAHFERLDPRFNRETVPVDLAGTKERIWERYEDRNRRAIKQAQETDLTVVETRDRSDIEAFHGIYSDAMDAKDADPHYRFDPAFFRELIREQRDVATLLVVRYDGDVVGGFIAVHDGQTAHHYLSASIPEYWDMRVNNLLFHEVVMHFHEQGFDTFDFQGGRPGVFKFKKGFSPARGEFYLATRTHMPDVYATLVDEAAKAGVDTDTEYFPAYRVEQSN